MSSVRLAVAVAVFVLSLMATGSARAQVLLVCQTPMFWCTFAAPMPVAGASCWCASQLGPIWGFSIVPPPPPPSGYPPSAGGNPPYGGNPGAGQPPALGDECFDGLGNCQGTFRGR